MLSYKNVAVFCGSRSGNNPIYAQEAGLLGTLLGQRKCHIIYGGGDIGLMGEFSRAAAKENVKITSIIPRAFVKVAKADIQIDPNNAVEVVETLFERKDKMLFLSDLVFALPGGIGTHDENFEVLAFNDLQKYLAPDAPVKPLIIVNTDGHFDGMRMLLEKSIDTGFVDAKMMDIIHWAPNTKEAVGIYDAIRTEPVPQARSLTL